MTDTTRTPNRLKDETSPYLQQHANNPVDWYPWCDEAFERARAEDKPVIVSIGYSACHWCHVMEHESFEDEEVAAVMNERFINIKVDMEERPDVDQIYMSFVQLTTGRGGWPMNVFVTPDKLPFFGGTYFPPSPRYGMPSWRQILLSISEAWNERRDELMSSADDILGELRRMTQTGGSSPVNSELLDVAYQSFVRSFDATNGGWGGAPKFPQAMSMDFLLRYWYRTGEQKALDMVAFTAKKMARGGIYDQLGGGFHRYAVDSIWLVPHFEKMLYDNAQLIRLYVHLFQITGDEEFRCVAIETIEYVIREMLDEKGGFYSAQDADSEGEEGKFFVWTPEQAADVLGEDDAAIFNKTYDVAASGNFEGASILNLRRIPDEEILSTREKFTEMRARLFSEREMRVKPLRDDKVLTAWNGLMLAAFSESGRVFGETRYLQIARANADFLLSQLSKDGRLLRTWKDGEAKLNGYIEDYANLVDGLLELFQATGELRYLDASRSLADAMIEHFWDDDEGGLFFTSDDHEELIVRNKDFYDNATPSGNSVAADVFLKLERLTGEGKYESYAVSILRLAAGKAVRHPQAFGRALSAMEFSIGESREVVITGPVGSEVERIVDMAYMPNAVIAKLRDGDDEDKLPIFEGREGGDAKVYVCKEMVCERPIFSAGELAELLRST
ncbi:MAG: thioredoxin domain-containing protein [Acidobacteriota bacterium]|nr:MAG: thioredoxin domain-containing protein [Acidobacteriota bacterium]